MDAVKALVWGRAEIESLIRMALKWEPNLLHAMAAEQNPDAVVRCFANIAPQPLSWLWPRRIPLGKITLLIGDPGLGKSLVTVDIASRSSRGTAFPDGAVCKAGNVILLSAEDDPADTIRPRLDAAGANVSRVHVLEAVRVPCADGSLLEKGFGLETDIAALEDVLNRLPDVRLIVIDPISAYLGGADSNTNAEVRGLLAPLAAPCSQASGCDSLHTHLRKSNGPAVHRAISSIAFAAAARAVWALASDPSDSERRLMLAVKQNLGPNVAGLAFRVITQNGLPQLAWESGTLTMDANDVLNAQDHENHPEQKEAEEWLREYLVDGPTKADTVTRNSKNPPMECGDPVESLPLADDASEDGEIRL